MDTTNDTISTTNAENTPEETPEETEENFSFGKIFKVVKFCWKSKIGFLCLNLVIVIILSVLTFIAMMYITRQYAGDAGWYSIGKYRYYFGNEKKTWIEAETDCKKKIGHLVKIENEQENKYLKSVAEVLIGDAWIGANDLDQEGQMRWVSDNSRVDFGFSDWYQLERKNEHRDCALFWVYLSDHYHSYNWTDFPCSHQYGYIAKSSSKNV